MENPDNTRLDGCSCNPVRGSHRPPCQWAAQARRADPAEVDGPGPDWYRELSETEGHAWPRGAHITRLNHTVGIALARTRLADSWPCRRCGGPKICPDLLSTLAYRQCGYAPGADPYGPWYHQ